MTSTLTDSELLALREAQLSGIMGFETGDPRGDAKALRGRRGVHLVYVLDPAVGFVSGAGTVRSDGEVLDWLRGANPGNWEAIEWDELLDGRLGPWAMVVDVGRVLSLCHTPVAMTEQAAEAGVWTDPRVRGRGHAAAATAGWAQLVGRAGRHLFYATLLDNRSSQRVAERLGARLVGWTWEAGEGGDQRRGGVHPLSSLAATGL